MSGPVDVLVEMQADIDALEQRVLAGEFTLSRGYEKVNRLRSIRGAVAELIEAVDELVDWVDGVLPSLDGEEGGNSKLASVREALARVGGAS